MTTSKSRLTVTSACQRLGSIRNDRRRPIEDLLRDIDEISQWAAAQKNNPTLARLLSEAHHLRLKILTR